jgi:hypothetical protein
MSLLSLVKPKGSNGFGYGSTAEQVTEGLSLSGRTIVVTGCNSGIGLETARVLAKRGARVIGTARTAEKASQALAGAGTGVACELADPASVRACAVAVKALGPIDAIVCNAGIMALPKRELAHGQELQFFTNHVGHFLLVTGLLDRLADDGRVVMVSSEAHRNAPPEGIRFDDLSFEKSYSPWTAYGQSKDGVRAVEAREPPLREGARASLRGHEEDRERGAPGRHQDEPRAAHEPARRPCARDLEPARAEEHSRGSGDADVRRGASRGGVDQRGVLVALQRGQAAPRRDRRRARDAPLGDDGAHRREPVIPIIALRPDPGETRGG